MNITKATWDLGRERGMSTKDIRANWGALYRTVYDDNVRSAKNGIDRIFDELEETVSSHTKTPQTEQAERNSLSNIRAIVDEAIKQNGYMETFEILANIYDNGAGDWIQRIVAAIYDSELASWSSGLPQYMSRLQSEVASAFNVNLDNIDVNLDMYDSDEQEIFKSSSSSDDSSDLFINGTNQMNVDRLRELIGDN